MTWTLIWIIGGAILFFCGYKVGHHSTMVRLYKEHRIVEEEWDMYEN